MKTFVNIAVATLLFLLGGFTVSAQQKINLLLSFSGQYAESDLKITMNDGINGFDIDSIINNKSIISRELFAPYAHLSIIYKGDQSYDYFIGPNPAEIHLSITREKDNIERLDCSAVNAPRIMDTTTSNLYKGLFELRKRHAEPIASFWQKHGNNFMRSDSLMRQYADIIKTFDSVTIDYLKDYPEDYFSFWFFKTQILDLSRIIAKAAPDYVEYLISYMLQTFPEQYTISADIVYTIESLRASTKVPIKVGEYAPDFETEDYNGNVISLKNLRGKLVLLDFWASWCGPCIAQIPEIKKLTEQFHSEDIEVIGVSLDRNPKDFKSTISQYEMTWKHILDLRKKISNLYSISAVPTILLIDREGKIIFKNDKGHTVNDLQKLINSNLSNGVL